MYEYARNMTNQNDKDKKIIKPLNREEVEEMLKNKIKLDSDPELIIENLGKTYSKLLNATKKEEADAMEEAERETKEALMMKSIETHVCAIETAGKEYRPLVTTMTKQFIAEYQAETPSEISLAQIAAIEYVRSMEFAKAINCVLRIEYLSQEKNGYYSLLGKELDRAERRMISAISTLKQLKTPTVNVKLNAKNAFIAENQQINADGTISTTTNNKNNELK